MFLLCSVSPGAELSTEAWLQQITWLRRRSMIFASTFVFSTTLPIRFMQMMMPALRREAQPKNRKSRPRVHYHSGKSMSLERDQNQMLWNLACAVSTVLTELLGYFAFLQLYDVL